MRLKALCRGDVEEVRLWRNKDTVGLRTPYLLTQEMQSKFYEDIISNTKSPHRYWAIYDNKGFVGMGGLTSIQWENSIAEISLIINPAFHKKGLGTKAVDLLLDQAFNYMGLKTVFGECYSCNDATGFWIKIAIKYNAHTTILPAKKFWNGIYHDSFYFSIDCDGYRKIHPTLHET